MVILMLFIIYLLLTSKNKENEVKTVVYTDTIHIHDTIRVKVKEIKYKEVKVIDTIYLNSTVIPVETKHYSDSLSDIWISGYKPEIDSINYHIPQQTIYIDKIVEVEKEKEKKWYEDRFIISAGVYTGYSPIYNNFDVIVGFGLGIRLN